MHDYFRYNKTYHCNTNYLADRYRTRILSQPGIKIKQLVELVRQDLNIYASMSTCRRAKIKVMSEAVGDPVAESRENMFY